MVADESDPELIDETLIWPANSPSTSITNGRLAPVREWRSSDRMPERTS